MNVHIKNIEQKVNEVKSEKRFEDRLALSPLKATPFLQFETVQGAKGLKNAPG